MRQILIAAVLLVCSSVSVLADGMRTVWVLSDKPESLSLQFNGREIAHFDQQWQNSGRGYLTQIAFPVSYVTQHDSLKLIREDGKGWSSWGPPEMEFLQNSNVGKGDPACVGGKAWCGVRGL